MSDADCGVVCPRWYCLQAVSPDTGMDLAKISKISAEARSLTETVRQSGEDWISCTSLRSQLQMCTDELQVCWHEQSRLRP